MINEVYEYTLDDDFQIVSTSSNWDSFAVENQGEACTTDRVVGKLLWEFVQGESVRLFLQVILMYCRESGQTLTFDCRRDSPDARRFFVQSVEYSENDGFIIRHRLENLYRPEAGPKVIKITEFLQRNRCSNCGSIKLPDGWVDIFSFTSESVDISGYEICEACRESIASQQKVHGTKELFRNTQISPHPNSLEKNQ